jgi:hypothetical protein
MISMNTTGISKALKEIRTYDRSMYMQITIQMRKDAQPLASEVGRDYPEETLPRWKMANPSNARSDKRPFPTYSPSAARGGMKPKVTAGRNKDNPRGIVRIQQMTAGGAILDSAGSRVSNPFVKNLDKKHGGSSRVGQLRSRVLYRAVARRKPQVEAIVAKAVATTDKIVQRVINS